MEIGEALEITLELARDNVLEDKHCENDEVLLEEQQKQKDACNTVEDFIVNVIGEDRL